MAKYAYFGVIACHPCKMFFKRYAENKQVRQLIDLALLANNMLKGEALAKFVKRSVELL